MVRLFVSVVVLTAAETDDDDYDGEVNCFVEYADDVDDAADDDDS